MKRKKVRKMRGSHTHGYGSKKKHRGKGSRGGKGYAGSDKHKKSYISRYEPEHFGKHGFTSLKKLKKSIRIINLDGLEKISKGNEIDLTQLGYDKLLGKGNVTRPLTIRVKLFSKMAKDKVEKVGGKIV